MKQLLFALLAVTVIYISSCGSDSSGSGGLGPNGGGGGNTVTFTMTGAVDPNNSQNYNFGFKPSVDVKLTTLIASLAAQGFADTIQNGNPTYNFSKDTTYLFGPYTGIQTGQAWSFKFTGTVTSSNTAYTSTSNFTVP